MTSISPCSSFESQARVHCHVGSTKWATWNVELETERRYSVESDTIGVKPQPAITRVGSACTLSVAHSYSPRISSFYAPEESSATAMERNLDSMSLPSCVYSHEGQDTPQTEHVLSATGDNNATDRICRAVTVTF